MKNINNYFDESLKLKLKENINNIIEKLNIPQNYFIKIYLISFILLCMRILPFYVCNLTIYIFPFLQTNKILQEEISDNYKKWILYWCLFSISLLLDEIVSFIINLFPFYFLLKFFIFTWLGLPNFDGTNYILENYFFDYINHIKRILNLDIVNKTIVFDLNKYLMRKEISNIPK